MLQSHCYHHVLFSIPSVPLSLPHSPSLSIPLTLSPFLNFLHKPTILHPVSATPPSSSSPWLTHLAELAATAQDGPIELPLSTPSIFATTDEPSTIQIATSVLLTGAITVFLFRSIRRRAKRAKELKFRSSGVKKSLKEEALDNLKAMGSSSIEAKGTPSPVQALIGGISAGIIALILYKFTTTIEAALNRQTVSDNFSDKSEWLDMCLFNLCDLRPGKKKKLCSIQKHFVELTWDRRQIHNRSTLLSPLCAR
ncbi:uncharacterized protein LOC129316093 isoform X2 [Prosopis cineraria]|uniref:uncharacterized protein LOC129316093 isoform X2 n=1 Tax=Prosopis cineraria TaxID=364024 RepID=UPI00240F0586|nr:uncharacterized protein LOC129316093 isoform X2 [Prosopis cineraria]